MDQICRRIEEAAKTEIGRRLLSHHLKFLHQDRFQDVSTDINKLYEKLSTEIYKLTEADTYIYQKIDSQFASLIKLHEDIYAKIESGNDMLRAEIDLIKDFLRVWLDEISLLKESIGNAPNVHLKLTAIESEIVRVKATLAAIQVAQAGALLSEDSSYDNLESYRRFITTNTQHRCIPCGHRCIPCGPSSPRCIKQSIITWTSSTNYTNHLWHH